MNHKMVITLSMIWIGAMALASTPEWGRAFRDFILTHTGSPAAARPTSGPVSSANPGGTRSGRVGGSR